MVDALLGILTILIFLGLVVGGMVFALRKARATGCEYVQGIGMTRVIEMVGYVVVFLLVPAMLLINIDDFRIAGRPDASIAWNTALIVMSLLAPAAWFALAVVYKSLVVVAAVCGLKERGGLMPSRDAWEKVSAESRRRKRLYRRLFRWYGYEPEDVLSAVYPGDGENRV